MRAQLMRRLPAKGNIVLFSFSKSIMFEIQASKESTMTWIPVISTILGKQPNPCFN